MKHQFTPAKNTWLLTAFASIFLSLAACQNVIDDPPLSCPALKMTATIGTKVNIMHFSSGIIFRSRTDSGGLKLLNIETASDSVKIVFNLTDGMYDESAMKNDSLHRDTFYFPHRGAPGKGLVVVSVANNNGNFDLLTTDTSQIIIDKVNTRAKTISGSFSFMANSGTVTGRGTFENACYVSL
ncbi:MAG: hypothetical protein J7623_25080 [Chitinophaga sp.]|uniref:hypothetical protein n=1 Tax=Chitinophaga sp. TaxID=1869181 RepID=UPI001B0B42CC|nr:hypothetical protein [Chitinophaga sp.]MBO9731940.1 hypothetical protein [Chitinophaga sp.]